MMSVVWRETVGNRATPVAVGHSTTHGPTSRRETPDTTTGREEISNYEHEA